MKCPFYDKKSTLAKTLATALAKALALRQKKNLGKTSNRCERFDLSKVAVDLHCNDYSSDSPAPSEKEIAQESQP